ncbi:MAG: orotate phosphoribosyltransferase [candidate division FCPU426 bacterium]
MSQEAALSLFKESGAYLDGHFLLTSGMHSPAYVEKFRVLEHPAICDQLCAMMAEPFKNEKIDVVLGPAVGGILLAYGVARALGCRSVFMEREEGVLKLRRGFEIKADERVLLVEDVVTTGSSVFEMLSALSLERGAGGLAGISFLVDRSNGVVDFKLPRQQALLTLDLPVYAPEKCPLCAKGLPLTKRGSRKI